MPESDPLSTILDSDAYLRWRSRAAEIGRAIATKIHRRPTGAARAPSEVVEPAYVRPGAFVASR